MSLSTTRGFRALISTHSRHVLDTVRGTAEVIWLNNGLKVDYSNVTIASMLLDLGALDSIDYFTNGNLSCLFATEDSSLESIKALEVLLASNGFNMTQTEIRPYSGCSKVDSAIVLRAFLKEKAPRVAFVLHRDRDYMPGDAAKEFETKISAIEAYPFLTAHSDVENYFINAEHLGELNGIDPARVQQLIDEATFRTRGASVQALINIRTSAALKAGSGSLNAGKLSEEANKDYDADPVTWRRGKPVLGTLIGLLQAELKKNPTVFQPSPHLKCATLTSIASKIWVAPAAAKAA